jgi:hypothetical protein
VNGVTALLFTKRILLHGCPLRLHLACQSVYHSPLHRHQRLLLDADGTLLDFDRAPVPPSHSAPIDLRALKSSGCGSLSESASSNPR